MRFIQAAAESRVLVPSQPCLLFAATFFESGLMVVCHMRDVTVSDDSEAVGTGKSAFGS